MRFFVKDIDAAQPSWQKPHAFFGNEFSAPLDEAQWTYIRSSVIPSLRCYVGENVDSLINTARRACARPSRIASRVCLSIVRRYVCKNLIEIVECAAFISKLHALR